MGKELACNAGDAGSGRSPGGGHSSPLQYFCLENPTDTAAGGRATVHRVTKSQIWLKWLSTTHHPFYRGGHQDSDKLKHWVQENQRKITITRAYSLLFLIPLWREHSAVCLSHLEKEQMARQKAHLLSFRFRNIAITWQLQECKYFFFFFKFLFIFLSSFMEVWFFKWEL